MLKKGEKFGEGESTKALAVPKALKLKERIA